MSADFWAGYASGAVGILIGNPLDIVKVQLQAGQEASIATLTTSTSSTSRYTSLIRGATAPILGYGALNALLFVSYNRTLQLLDQTITNPTELSNTKFTRIWAAGAVGGLVTWIISAPTELIKCRAQLGREGQSSFSIAQSIWQRNGIRGFYIGGGVTSVRDSVGYGFYFSSYELSKRIILREKAKDLSAVSSLLCGGIAGIITWASVFPLDTIKTRLQSLQPSANIQPLVALSTATTYSTAETKSGAWQIAKQAYRQDGLGIFFRGLGVCSVRAFIVNGVQWTVYEWILVALGPDRIKQPG